MTTGDPDLSKYFAGNVTTISDNCQTGALGSYCSPYYPLYYTYPDKTRQAFAVAKKLLAEKFVKTDSIEKFVSLVEMIEKTL